MLLLQPLRCYCYLFCYYRTCAGRPGIGDSRAAWPPGRLAPWPLPPGQLAAWAFTAPLLPQPRAALQLLLLLLLLALDGLHAEQLIGCRASPWPAPGASPARCAGRGEEGQPAPAAA